MEIVINRCFGGFNLSHKATMEYAKRKGIKLHPIVNKRGYNGKILFDKYVPYTGVEKSFLIHYTTRPLTQDGALVEGSYYYPTIPRNDPDLIAVVREMGAEANGLCAELAIVEIPDDVEWEISEYDGRESIEERHRSWG